ncbi:MAG: hypothetical protein VX346_07920 [Planctomycetota bacterium]|nr:hypothetical protein [Planctomycetota bacterium]
MAEAVELLFVGPNAVASVCLLIIFGLVSISALGALDLGSLDVLDVGVGVEGTGDALMLGLLAVPLRFLNLGKIPAIIWMSIFAWIFWAASLAAWLLLDQSDYAGEENLISTADTVKLALRNLVGSLFLTKLASEPLKGLFESKQRKGGNELVGEGCEIWSHHADEQFGQARFHTEGAPLLLNVRTTGKNMKKGDTGNIVSYDELTNVYVIDSAVDTPSSSSEEKI